MKQDYNCQKRILAADNEKLLDTEKQKLKLVEAKLDEKCAELVNVKTDHEQEKARIITDLTERLNNSEELLERVKSEKRSQAKLHEKSLNDLKASQDLYCSELKSQNDELRREVEAERVRFGKLKDKYHSEKLEANAKQSKLEQDLFLASENLAQSEANKERLDNEITQLDKQRKEQLLELGVLREKEKQEAEVRYIKAFQKAELEIKNQCELKLQEKIAAFKKKHRKELDMLDAHLKNVEASYKDKCTEYDHRKSEFSAQIEKLQRFKDKEQSTYQANLDQMRQEFEENLHCERLAAEERVAEIMADCEMERTRVERAERRIEKLGREHRNEIDDLKSKFSRDTEDLLPKSVQMEFESTIDSLHGELKDLRRTVKTMMASNQRKLQIG